ncbi:hypothetical protein ACA910_014106 [Epithemia clementina (nom. ined.)]
MNRTEPSTSRLYPKTAGSSTNKDKFLSSSISKQGDANRSHSSYASNKTKYLESSSKSSPQLTWWRIASRLRVFILGVIVGSFVVRPIATSLPWSSMLSNYQEHSLQQQLEGKPSSSLQIKNNDDNRAGPSRSKLTFLKASRNVTSVRRSKRLNGNSEAPSQETMTEHHPESSSKKSMPKESTKSTKGETKIKQVEATAAWPQGSKSGEIVDFERQPKVVIATKIHGPPHIKQLIQSMCLLKAAYNNRPRYDVIVFTTLPLSSVEEKNLRDVVHPANLEVVVDSKTLADHLKTMSDDQVQHLVKRCQVNSTDELFWWTRCCEEWTPGACMPLSYSWQSEFRSLHLWASPALKPYKYMLWFDSDAMPTKIWSQDPVAFMIRNELKILFNNFPQGKSAGTDVHAKLMEAYNDTICKLKLVDGHLEPTRGDCHRAVVANIHGFFHVTDLDFYRTAENLSWSRIMIGENKFSRRWDDQLAVTVPAAMRAPEKAWDMNYHNITLDVYHNGIYDGKRPWKLKSGKVGGGYQKWWKEYSEERFPEAIDSCQAWIRNSG